MLEAKAIASIVIALFVVSSAGWIRPAHAQEIAQVPGAEKVVESPVDDFSKPMGPADELNRGTPRGSMYGFVVASRQRDYERASRFLDLRRLPPEQVERGPELARQFKTVLDQALWIDFATLDDTNGGASGDGLPTWQDKLGQIQTESGPVDILLQRVPRKADEVRIWKVSAASVAMIDDLHAEFGPGILEKSIFRRRALVLPQVKQALERFPAFVADTQVDANLRTHYFLRDLDDDLAVTRCLRRNDIAQVVLPLTDDPEPAWTAGSRPLSPERSGRTG